MVAVLSFIHVEGKLKPDGMGIVHISYLIPNF